MSNNPHCCTSLNLREIDTEINFGKLSRLFWRLDERRHRWLLQMIGSLRFPIVGFTIVSIALSVFVFDVFTTYFFKFKAVLDTV